MDTEYLCNDAKLLAITDFHLVNAAALREVPDTITVCRARRRLTKLIDADGRVTGFDNARLFDFIGCAVTDLAHLARLLAYLAGRADCCIVRGGVIDPTRAHAVRRLLHPDPQTGEAPTLHEVPRWWLSLDVDGMDRPADLPADDLAGCAAAAIRRLPAPFHGAACVAQATGSHGIKRGLYLRMWFWLSRPVSGAELKRWLRGVPVDHAVFGPAQPIYTAAPVFTRGATDPLPNRMVTLAGAATVPVPPPGSLAPPPLRRLAPLPAKDDCRAARYAAAALTNAAVRVASASVGARHGTILSEARSLARFIDAGLLHESEVRAVLMQAGQHAGKPGDEVQSMMSWAIAHPRAIALPEGLAR
jgi:hypothetical protein